MPCIHERVMSENQLQKLLLHRSERRKKEGLKVVPDLRRNRSSQSIVRLGFAGRKEVSDVPRYL